MSATVVERKHSDFNAEPSSDGAISEEVRSAHGDSTTVTKEAETEIKGVPVYNADDEYDDETRHDTIIVTGADAAKHLLPLRDDGEPALTFRSIFLATLLSGFQAVMSQIYEVS